MPLGTQCLQCVAPKRVDVSSSLRWVPISGLAMTIYKRAASATERPLELFEKKRGVLFGFVFQNRRDMSC